MIVAALAIFGCAGVERKCVDEAMVRYHKMMRITQVDLGYFAAEEIKWAEGTHARQLSSDVQRCVE